MIGWGIFTHSLDRTLDAVIDHATVAALLLHRNELHHLLVTGVDPASELLDDIIG